MRIFTPLYRKMMIWARHPHAERYLIGASFAESWVFPLPTSILLASMVFANRQSAWRLASIASIASVLGGMLGYAIGYFFFEQLGRPILEFYAAEQTFHTMQQWFTQYGAWLVLISGATPIPYKIFTIASGLFGLPILWFLLASIVGRAAQFFLVAGLLWWGGEKIQHQLEKWLEVSGWGFLALTVVIYVLWLLL